MAQISGNTCNIITIAPMEVECYVTNASNAETQNGSIQLDINGGTSPYTVVWDNGTQGKFIGGLSPGNYTATITDYNGDYVISKTCTVQLQSTADTGRNDPYLNKFFKCDDSYNPDIYVFYDGVSLNTSTLSLTSESIRSSYQGLVNNGFGGQLYEGVIGSKNNNGENWLWWATYPYLGSLTGGTLSDSTVVSSFGLNGESVDNSVYDSRWCQSNDSGKCVPNNPSFNFSTTTPEGLTSDLYKRINNGYQLTGTYGVNDSRTNGVPFTVTSSMDGNSSTVYGDFIGGQIEYKVIIITNNADDEVGMYHGKVPVYDNVPYKDFLIFNPFELYGDYWNVQTEKEYTNRFEYEYESFLKVWEDIKDQNGEFDGLVYPNITNSGSSIPYLQHLVASIEGDTISNTEFQTKYDSDIQSVGPLNLNLINLETQNVYKELTGTTTYSSLPLEYKNGAGLKNFGWKTNPTMVFDNQTNISNKFTNYLNNNALTSTELYTNTLNGVIENKVYKLSGITGCYSYDSTVLNTGQTYQVTVVDSVYNECISCDPSAPNPVIQPKLCLTSNNLQYTFTQTGVDVNGNFTWENSGNSITIQYNISNDRWEVTPWLNVGEGLMIQNSNNTIPIGTWVNVGVSRPDNWTIIEGECLGLPITVNATTYDEVCEGDNNGSVILEASGGQPPYSYRIPNVAPYPAYSPSGLFLNLIPDSYVGEVSGTSGSATVAFTINEGSPETEYIISTTYEQQSLFRGALSWSYDVQVTPALPTNITLNFDIELTHQRIERDSGTAIFSQSHQIVKNGNLNLSYNTTTDIVDTTNVCSDTVIETNTIFKQIANSVDMSGGDTIVGSVTQSVIIDGGGAACSPEDCQMLGKYITSLQIKNISVVGGSSCDSAIYPTPLSNITVSEQDCSS